MLYLAEQTFDFISYRKICNISRLKKAEHISYIYDPFSNIYSFIEASSTSNILEGDISYMLHNWESHVAEQKKYFYIGYTVYNNDIYYRDIKEKVILRLTGGLT